MLLCCGLTGGEWGQDEDVGLEFDSSFRSADMKGPDNLTSQSPK